MSEVIVVGAGTTGLIIAQDLALRGIEVTVFDSGKAPGEHAAKASGLVSRDGLNRIGIDYRSSIVNSVEGALLHADGETLTVRARTTKAYVLDRIRLATTMCEAARDAGAEIKFGHRVTREELHSYEDKIIVGADGAVSTVASAFNFPALREQILTYKAEYQLHAGSADPKMVELFFERNARGLFGWTIPYSDSTLEVGIGLSSRVRNNSRSAFKSFLGANLRERLEGSRELSGHASMIPIGIRRVTVKKNVALAGDAAGQVKATTGGGIVYGSLCARALSKCVYNTLRMERPLTDYEKVWRELYGRDLELHALMHSFYSRIGPSGMKQSLRLAKLLGFEGFLSKYGDMDRPSLMIRRFFDRGHG